MVTVACPFLFFFTTLGFKESLHVMPASPASEVVYENLQAGRMQRAFAQVSYGYG